MFLLVVSPFQSCQKHRYFNFINKYVVLIQLQKTHKAVIKDAKNHNREKTLDKLRMQKLMQTRKPLILISNTNKNIVKKEAVVSTLRVSAENVENAKIRPKTSTPRKVSTMN